MPALLVQFDPAESFGPRGNAREQQLFKAYAEADRQLDALLGEMGLINRAHGTDGYTPLQQRIEAVRHAAIQLDLFYQRQAKELRRQLERVLASDALTDTDLRALVLSAVNEHRGGDRRLADAQLLTREEQQVVDSYRRLATTDRAVLRALAKRLAAEVTDNTAAAGGAR